MFSDNSLIRVRNLGKKYYFNGLQDQYLTLRDFLINLVKTFLKRFYLVLFDERIWALKELSLDMGIGKIAGIIGQKYAGTSTLPAGLSRFTASIKLIGNLHKRDSFRHEMQQYIALFSEVRTYV